jgi:hypothetical protein
MMSIISWLDPHGVTQMFYDQPGVRSVVVQYFQPFMPGTEDLLCKRNGEVEGRTSPFIFLE